MNDPRQSNLIHQGVRPMCASWILPLLLLALPAAVQAQFNYTINNGAVTITGYIGPGGAVTIPSTINGLPVTAIGGYLNIYDLWVGAFYQCTSLTSVTIPNSVTSIGEGAFEQCTRLASLTIPNSVTNIGDFAFGNCGLTNVTIPNSITTIRNGVFETCYYLTSVTIPNSVSSIGFAAFHGCYRLASLTIPNSVTNIGTWAFLGCSGLGAITVDPLNPAYSSLDGVLFNKSQTTLVQYPGAVAGSYTIPNGVTNFHDAFRFCFGLTSVTIPNSATSIDDWSFQECMSLTNVSIPNSVTSIGDFAIHWCTSLTSITIPYSVTSIGDNAFDFCTSLTNVAIPNSVTNLGGSVFRSCTSLTVIAVDASNPAYSSVDGVLFNKSQTTLLECPPGKAGSYTIPISVVSIGGYAFETCYSFTNFTIPNSVTNIGYAAFAEGDGLTGVYFLGNAPTLDGLDVFSGDNNATIYYLPGTAGWGATFGGRPTALWPPPTIQTSPLTQTADAGSVVGFRVRATIAGDLVPGYQWFFNGTSCLSCTNSALQLADVQSAQAGVYTLVVTDAAGSVTSPPAILNVIPQVERRMVPALTLIGQPGSSLNLDFSAVVRPNSQWTTLDNVQLPQASQWYFDLTAPLASQRFYRVWQTGTPSVTPALDLHIVPAITLTGNIGDKLRLDYINRFGPTDAWVTLDTVMLTNTSQLYFDTSAIGQPPRLWRVIPVPQPES